MSIDLVAWLRGALDDDERVARGLDGATRIVGQRPNFYGAGGPAAEAFWARFTPRTMLATIAATRLIIDAHTTRTSVWWPDVEACEVEVCVVCSGSEYSGQDDDVEAPCPTVRLLALPFAERTGYREEWRP